jgi:hypothetical protein
MPKKPDYSPQPLIHLSHKHILNNLLFKRGIFFKGYNDKEKLVMCIDFMQINRMDDPTKVNLTNIIVIISFLPAAHRCCSD